MKFNGEKIAAIATAEIALPRPDGNHLFLLVRAMGLGEDREAKRLFPEPEPPYGYLTDEHGKPLRDPDSGKVEHGPLFSDEKFLSALEDCERYRSVVKFARAIDKDDRITFETTKDPYTREWYMEVSREIEGAGLSEGDILLVIRKALELGNLDGDALKRAAEAFSSRGRAQE